MKTIDTQPVESSQIHSIGYDADSSKLAVRFKGRKGEPTSLYYYSDFTQANFDALKTADSIGSHFYKHIKPFPERFPYVCIEKMPAPTADIDTETAGAA
ncbi:KTSC domain-containing protein [Burkholderia cenocepacia]|uniref:KTSC domain-containing protein n=1 Tax=Burkholderia cenocepacia TaxID=95486 RepID=UPI0023B8C539|nr:KTSC domain-containing protein [Burkholderia cenocepacia]MDF0501590.1 KTSC domain-containing protein [Burkholderia cenocepacia]